MTKRKGVEERQSRPSLCVGCGEAAAGYNYDTPSCFSCKTFFRRTVVSKRVFNGCLKSGLCAREDALKQCRACRFEKCIKGGMNASLISDNNNQTKQEYGAPASANYNKMERKEDTTAFVDKPCSSNPTSDSSPNELVVRGKQNSSNQTVNAEISNASKELRLVANPSRFECKVEKMIQNLLISSYTPMMMGGITIDEFVEGPSKLGNHFGVMCTQPVTPFPIPIFPVEVLVKYRQRLDFSGFDYSTRKLWFFQDCVYSIEYMKSLPIYHLLDSISKRALLASTLTCSNLTSAFFSYSHRSDRTLYPDGGTLTWTSKELNEAPGTVRLYSAIIATMRSADLNAHEYALLKMIVVCNPMLEGICPLDATLLRHEKERCTKSLLSYVLARRGVNEGPAFFNKILSVANVVMQVTSWEKAQHILATAMGLYDGSATPFGEATFHSN